MANECNSTYNFSYFYDVIITSSDYWTIINDIYAGHPTALEITSALHWWAIRGYDYTSGTHYIYCTNSATSVSNQQMNFDALGTGLFTITIRD